MPTLPAISPRGNAAASSNRSKKVRASRIASARVLFTEYTAETCTLHSALAPTCVLCAGLLRTRSALSCASCLPAGCC
jgi:hypothetical protein